MTPQEVRSRVEEEIGENWALSNAHGIELSRCLVTPQKGRYRDSFHEGQTIELWLVLEEDPVARKGYKIVYDEDADKFGLAVADDRSAGVFLGLYGSFLETLSGM